jgi:hypothetical protein
MNKVITFSNYFKFKAKIIAVPTSDNILGDDLYPRYFMRPTELIEVLEHTNNVRSTDSGFIKDSGSGLFLKNRNIGDKITLDEIIGQFELIAMSPPYWFHNEDTYLKWAQINMSSEQSSLMKSKYINSRATTVEVLDGEDEEILLHHFYKEVEYYQTKVFHKSVLGDWPKQKGIHISKPNLTKLITMEEDDTTT